MKKFRLTNFNDKFIWMKYFECNGNPDLVPMLEKIFLDDDIESATKQAFCIIMDYLKTSNFMIRNIRVENALDRPVRYIFFREDDYDYLQGIFTLEEV